PVLIIGMPRSGTTLVEQIISMHPEVGAGDELNFWNERGASWHRSGAVGNEKAFLAKAAADYLGVLRAIAPKAARVTDKMPFNFLWTGLIHLAFPRAITIHCRRAAVDTALSIHQTHFHRAWLFRPEVPNWSPISEVTRGSSTIGGACCRRIASC